MASDLNAYAALKDPKTPLAMRLVAHSKILEAGMPTAGDIARQERMAEALGDLCVAVAMLLTKAGSVKIPAAHGSSRG